MVCERRPVTEKKNVADARSDGCRDEVAGGRSAGATIAAGQNRRVGSPLHLYLCELFVVCINREQKL